MGTYQVAVLDPTIQYLVNFLFLFPFYSFVNSHHILLFESDATVLASASMKLLKQQHLGEWGCRAAEEFIPRNLFTHPALPATACQWPQLSAPCHSHQKSPTLVCELTDRREELLRNKGGTVYKIILHPEPFFSFGFSAIFLYPCIISTHNSKGQNYNEFLSLISRSCHSTNMNLVATIATLHSPLTHSHSSLFKY